MVEDRAGMLKKLAGPWPIIFRHMVATIHIVSPVAQFTFRLSLAKNATRTVLQPEIEERALIDRTFILIEMSL